MRNSLTTDIFLSLILGALLNLCFAPFSIWPLIGIIFPALYGLFNRRIPNGKAGFWIGYGFGFGYFSLGWFWIAEGVLIYTQNDWGLAIFTTIGLAASMAFYLAFSGYCYAKLSQYIRSSFHPLLLALCLAITDYARGYLFSGFPWNSYGYIGGDFLPLVQTMSLWGASGQSLIILVMCLLPITFWHYRLKIAGLRGWLSWAGLSLCLPMLVIIYGYVRLYHIAEPQIDPASPATLANAKWFRLVQPAIPQEAKWNGAYFQANLDQYISLSNAPRIHSSGGEYKLSAVIWPETALPFLMDEDYAFMDYLRQKMPEKAVLITGTISAVDEPITGYYNTLLAIPPTPISAKDRDRLIYHKYHLVPFGEYLPFRSFWKKLGLEGISPTKNDYKQGVGPQIMSIDGLPAFVPLICYEAIFPLPNLEKLAGDSHLPQPQLLVNMSNDAWFGHLTGPYQHKLQARMRSIESGLPLLRVTPTGISAGFDGYGRLLNSIELGEAGVIDIPLIFPHDANGKGLAAGQTLYQQVGDYLWWIMLTLFALLVFAAAKPIIRSNPTSHEITCLF